MQLEWDDPSFHEKDPFGTWFVTHKRIARLEQTALNCREALDVVEAWTQTLGPRRPGLTKKTDLRIFLEVMSALRDQDHEKAQALVNDWFETSVSNHSSPLSEPDDFYLQRLGWAPVSTSSEISPLPQQRLTCSPMELDDFDASESVQREQSEWSSHDMRPDVTHFTAISSPEVDCLLVKDVDMNKDEISSPKQVQLSPILPTDYISAENINNPTQSETDPSNGLEASDPSNAVSSAEIHALEEMPYHSFGNAISNLVSHDTTPLKKPSSSPPVWANARQELGETLPYFRIHQGGVYNRDGIAYGYLLGSNKASGDICHLSGRIIISHGGSKQCRTEPTSVVQDGPLVDPIPHQTAALLTCYKRQQPIILITSHDWPLFGYDIEGFVVLGWYWITNAWVEPNFNPDSSAASKYHYKFRFQWLEAQGEPWWDLDSPSAVNFGMSIPSIACIQCSQPSPIVYASGWRCLNNQCPQFWVGWSPETQDYYEQILKLVPCPDSLKRVPYDCNTAHSFGEEMDEYLTSAWQGFLCRTCNKLSRRVQWQTWTCSNCGNITRTAKQVFTARRIVATSSLSAGHTIRHPDRLHHSISRLPDLSIVWKYDLPKTGTIYVIRATPNTKKFADDLFTQYQEAANTNAMFARRSVQAQVKGALTRHFEHNAGHKYKFCVDVETIPMTDAPAVVVKAKEFLEEMTSKLKAGRWTFNEVLSCAYLNGMRMGYHSDDELGVAGLIASLSLGSPAKMKFRRKWMPDPLGENRRQPDLTLLLHHGDVLVMDGESIQKLYDHQVQPCGLRFAATARHID